MVVDCLVQLPLFKISFFFILSFLFSLAPRNFA